MKLLVLLLVFLSCAELSAQNQASEFVHVEVTLEAHGFMCPFLTPMFLGYLEDRGCAWVHHDPNASLVSFALPLDSLRAEDEFTERLVLIGYQEKQIAYTRFDTTATLPIQEP